MSLLLMQKVFVRSENNRGMYCHFIHFLFNIFVTQTKIKHLLFPRNTFRFDFTSKQTILAQKRPKNLMRQIIVTMTIILRSLDLD